MHERMGKQEQGRQVLSWVLQGGSSCMTEAWLRLCRGVTCSMVPPTFSIPPLVPAPMGSGLLFSA